MDNVSYVPFVSLDSTFSKLEKLLPIQQFLLSQAFPFDMQRWEWLYFASHFSLGQESSALRWLLFSVKQLSIKKNLNLISTLVLNIDLNEIVKGY